ncbi:PC-esterase domain-containing protein 1B isoform X2 [Tupaia chinensis]|uniref:Protein FAM113B n=2 Tax=Tupaia chinensis TaxID=246437 RepID=L8Y6U4_TUPCH|nr:PC-esterase domain-containing protein 1B isoform X2 [Tupaia chinensis]ELV10705.1 Protein FAM113B [Tupaia chinensis]
MIHLLASEVRQLLHNKFVIILGDSVHRAVYKDLVLLLQKDCLLSPSQLKATGELSFEQDELMEGGQKGVMHNGINYREVREFCSDHHLVRFYFITRAYSEYLEAVLEKLQSGEPPDVVIMNSCLWDVSRYGKDFWGTYLENLETLFGRLGQVLPASCLLVWNTAMPVGDVIRGRFKLPKHLPTAAALKAAVVEANFYSFAEAKKHGFDVLDLHFHFRHARQHLQQDGVHWDERAHRHLSQLLLAHVADAWNVELPHRSSVGRWIKYGPERDHPGQRGKGQSWASRDKPALLQSPPVPAPRTRPLLPSPSGSWRLPLPPPPLLPPQPPFLPPQVVPPLPLCPPDSYFSSDRTFQSDQFYFHSDGPSPTQTGFSFQADFMGGPQLPVPCFPAPLYLQQTPVVHRGFPRPPPRGPYALWRRRPRPSKSRPPTGPEPRPQ